MITIARFTPIDERQPDGSTVLGLVDVDFAEHKFRDVKLVRMRDGCNGTVPAFQASEAITAMALRVRRQVTGQY